LRNSFISKLHELASLDSNIMLLTGDLGFGVVEEFEINFPDQFLNCGVAEQNMIGMAAGLASEGKKVFVYSIANFPTFRCLEQIRNDICYHNFPVTIVSIGSGFSYGTLGYTHFAIEDISIMRSLPGIRILSPTDPLEVKSCLDLITLKPQPTYLRLGKNGEPAIHSMMDFEIEKLNFIIEGGNILIISTGSISKEVKTAVSQLNMNNTNKFSFATLSQLKPLDLEFSILEKFDSIITVEEHSIIGGLGSIINDFLITNNFRKNVLNIAIPDVISHKLGSTNYLRDQFGLNSEKLKSKIRNFIRN
jgi:transketolase